MRSAMNTSFTSKIEEHCITVNGIRTRYLTAGAGEPIVLIHGIGGFAERWQPAIDQMSPAYRVLAPDVVGFGRSDKPKDRVYTYQTFATFILSFLDALQLQQLTLIGHSLGGGIALQTSIYAPGRIKKLVIISSGGLGREFSIFLRLMTLPILGELAIRSSLEGVRRSQKMGVYDPSVIREGWVQDAFEMSSLPGAAGIFLKTLRDSSNLFGGFKSVIDPIANNLDKISAPTLIIWGENDTVIPFKYAAVAKSGIAGSRVFALKQCGHQPIQEHPEKVLDEISAFIG
jgi:pimeloyl-ACP methyl ester carboxylesterase